MLRVLRRQADGALFGAVWEAGLTEHCDNMHPWETVDQDGMVWLRRVRLVTRQVESYEFGVPVPHAAGDWYMCAREPVRAVQVPEQTMVDDMSYFRRFLAPLGDDLVFFETRDGFVARISADDGSDLFTLIRLVPGGGHLSIVGPREFGNGRVPVHGDWIVRMYGASVIIADPAGFKRLYSPLP